MTDVEIDRMKPKVFDNEDVQNEVRRKELSFEHACTNLEEIGVLNPKGLTVFEFYSKIRYFKNKETQR